MSLFYLIKSIKDKKMIFNQRHTYYILLGLSLILRVQLVSNLTLRLSINLVFLDDYFYIRMLLSIRQCIFSLVFCRLEIVCEFNWYCNIIKNTFIIIIKIQNQVKKIVLYFYIYFLAFKFHYNIVQYILIFCKRILLFHLTCTYPK